MNVQARDAAQEFGHRFGRRPTVSRAPGRVNLIGEHTDYNEGFVMPAALEFATLVAASPRPDRRLNVYSLIMDESRAFDLDAPAEPGRRDWSDYVFGVAVMLERSGRRLKGADLVVSTDVPLGSGLSSSAALEVSSAHALLDRLGSAVRADRDRQDLPEGRERLRRHALRDHGSICVGLRRRRQCAPHRLPHARIAQRPDRPEPEAPRGQLVGAPSARGRRIQRQARSLRRGRAPAQARARADPGAARRDAGSPRGQPRGFCPTSSIAAAATSSPRTPGCSRPSAR